MNPNLTDAYDSKLRDIMYFYKEWLELKEVLYQDKVKKVGREEEGIRYKYREIAKCQGCLKRELSCPEGAIKPVKFEA